MELIPSLGAQGKKRGEDGRKEKKNPEKKRENATMSGFMLVGRRTGTIYMNFRVNSAKSSVI